MKATFGHQTRAPTELINDNTVTLMVIVQPSMEVQYYSDRHSYIYSSTSDLQPSTAIANQLLGKSV